MRRLRLGGLCCFAAACVLFGSAQAGAAPAPETMAITVPESLRWPDHPSASYRIGMTSPSEPRSFEIEWIGPKWPGNEEINGFLGSPLDYGVPYLEGAGTVERLRVRRIGRRYGLINPCRRGALPDPHTWPAARYRIRLPADASSTLVIPTELADAPRRGVFYGTFFNGYLIDPERFDGPANIISSWARLAVKGAVGIDVRFRNPAGERLWQLEGRSPRGLIGVTKPAVRNRKVKVRAIDTGYGAHTRVRISDWNDASSRPLGTYRTDRRGRFRLRSRRLPEKRYYRIMVRFPSPGPGLARDWDCGPNFNTWPFDP